MSLRGGDFLSLANVDGGELLALLDIADRMKGGERSDALNGQSVAMLFEHPSLRTRVTFEVAVQQLGGFPVYLGPEQVRLGERESASDIARNLERWVQAIVARVRSHHALLDLAEHTHIPVINALSDSEHPCQILADLQTIRNHFGRLRGVKVLYSGDGNNVCHSLLLGCAAVGAEIRVATPRQYEPRPEILALARRAAEQTGGIIRVGQDPLELVEGAQAVYTDVWASMGQEDQAEARRAVFAPYQVNAELLARAAPEAVVMHCLPAHRGEEITAEVIDGPRSLVFDQAENRLHAQKALLSEML